MRSALCPSISALKLFLFKHLLLVIVSPWLNSESHAITFPGCLCMLSFVHNPNVITTESTCWRPMLTFLPRPLFFLFIVFIFFYFLQTLCTSGSQRGKLRFGSEFPSRWVVAPPPLPPTVSPSITLKMTTPFWPCGWGKERAGFQASPPIKSEWQVQIDRNTLKETWAGTRAPLPNAFYHIITRWRYDELRNTDKVWAVGRREFDNVEAECFSSFDIVQCFKFSQCYGLLLPRINYCNCCN